MKYFIIILLTIFTPFILSAQDITGQWNGVLEVQNIQLRLIFNVSRTDEGYSATMDSPDQGAKDIPVTSTTFNDPNIKLEVSNIKLEYTGELKDNKIIGTLKQGGQEFPMNLSREAIEKAIVLRPQEPKKPYPYLSEEVTFKNPKASITLAGTFTLPKTGTNFPAVILISGSGKQDRNEEILGHKPFLVLSDYLTKNGIAVLRYDDRGVGESTGNFNAATSADFATDVVSAMNYLKTRKEIDKNKIGLIGHSEGGLIAAMVASKSKEVDFMVSMAGPGITGYEIILLQTAFINEASGMDKSKLKTELTFLKSTLDIIIEGNDLGEIKSVDSLQKQISLQPAALPEGTKAADVKNLVETFSSPWFQYFLKYDPRTSLEKVKCPVLAVNGAKDLQVPPKKNLKAIKTALEKGGNRQVTVKEFPNLNHLFQEAETGSPSEYGTIEQTFSPIAMEVIVSWIKVQTK